MELFNGAKFEIPDGLLYNTFGWVVACVAFHCLSALVLKPNWARFAAKPQHIRWSAYNRSVATFHSCVMFGLVLPFWYYSNPSLTASAGVQPELIYQMVDMMNGYLIYDAIHELNFPEKADKETILHHVLGLFTHLSARCLGSHISCFYFMMIYIAEGSTPFLHLCWGMYAMGYKETSLFKLVCLTVLASYFVVRIVWGPYMLWHMYTYRGLWSSVADQLLYLPNLAILAVFNVLNFIWFKALLVKFLTLPPDGKKIDYDNDEQLNNTGNKVARSQKNDDSSSSNKDDGDDDAAPAKRGGSRGLRSR